MNYYELLEVAPNASTEVIKNAYKTLAKKFHPDTYSGDRTFAEEKMKLLNEAIAVLGNEENRKIYNEENNIGIYSSMSTMFSSPDSTDSFIEEIDNFLNKKSKKSSKAEEREAAKVKIDTIDIDIDAEEDDIDDSDIDSEEDEYTESSAPMKYTEEEINNIISNEYYDGEDNVKESEIEEYARKLKKSRNRQKTKVGKWYYITVCVMIALNILLIFLITRTFNLSNIKSFFSAKASNAGNIGGKDEFDPEYNLENAGETDDETPESEIATEPSIEGDYALGISEGIPIPLAGNEDITEPNVTLPPQTQPPQTQAPATKAAVVSPAPAPTQKVTAAPAPTVPVVTAAPTEVQVIETTAAEETTEETIEQDTTVSLTEPESQESDAGDNITTEAESEAETEISESETVSPTVEQEGNAESVTEAPAPIETQEGQISEIESEVDIVEH